MSKYLVYGQKPITIDEPTDLFINSLCSEDSYKDGITVSKTKDDHTKHFQLLRGSKLAQHIKEGGRYGYEHCVAYKIGKTVGERFAKGIKTTFIKTKVDFVKLGNHATQNRINTNICSGIYSVFGSTKYLYYSIDGGFLFVKMENIKGLPYTLCRQTINALVGANKQGREIEIPR